MTTVVTISAHCGPAKEVHVVVTDAGSLVEEFDIADGETVERYAYDSRVIAVREVAKIDRHAKAVEDAGFNLRQAVLRFEDAASRGFPLRNADILKADVIAKHDALEALTTPAPSAGTPDPAIEAATETKTYADGSSATGPGPLPDHSPAEQEELSDGAKRVLDSFDEAPYAGFGNH